MATPEDFPLMPSSPLLRDPPIVSSDGLEDEQESSGHGVVAKITDLYSNRQRPKFRSGTYSLDRVGFSLKAMDILRYKHQDVRDDLRQV